MDTPLDSVLRIIPSEWKVRMYIQTVRLILEDYDSVSAEPYLEYVGSTKLHAEPMAPTDLQAVAY
ncbi:MAG: hypothetical protein J3Q66DRAFT_393888 [Benniella sp.]|nr:MAG: hypothetical protein J3Q66DRAFT_393888 [Benniella sp.]